MQFLAEIERKVEKMKSEGEATAQRLVQLRNQNEELVNQRDGFRNRVSLLMHRSQQREQVCCNLQYEISQLRTQLTGTSIVLGQSTGPYPASRDCSTSQLSPRGGTNMNSLDFEGMPMSEADPGADTPKAPIFHKDEDGLSNVPPDVLDGQQFPAALGSSPMIQYPTGPPCGELSPAVSSYISNADVLSSRFMTAGYGDPDRYFNWNDEIDDILPELSMVSRQAAAEPSDLFSAMLDNMCSDDPFPDAMFGSNLPHVLPDSGPSGLSSPTMVPRPYLGTSEGLGVWGGSKNEVNGCSIPVSDSPRPIDL